jgi:hypothetical protein
VAGGGAAGVTGLPLVSGATSPYGFCILGVFFCSNYLVDFHPRIIFSATIVVDLHYRNKFPATIVLWICILENNFSATFCILNLHLRKEFSATFVFWNCILGKNFLLHLYCGFAP